MTRNAFFGLMALNFVCLSKYNLNIPRGWWQDDFDEKNTIEGRKKKIQSLTKKGIKKFK